MNATKVLPIAEAFIVATAAPALVVSVPTLAWGRVCDDLRCCWSPHVGPWGAALPSSALAWLGKRRNGDRWRVRDRHASRCNMVMAPLVCRAQDLGVDR